LPLAVAVLCGTSTEQPFVLLILCELFLKIKEYIYTKYVSVHPLRSYASAPSVSSSQLWILDGCPH
jgi:hypothetical protein